MQHHAAAAPSTTEGLSAAAMAGTTASASPVPSADDPCLLAEQSLWQRWAVDRDTDAREQLVCLFLPYARIIAATMYGRRTHSDIDFAEYLQLASMGLIESIDRFDPQVGVQFKTYASKRMQGAILSGLERLTEKNQQIAVNRRLRQERLQAVKSQARQNVSEQEAQAAEAPGAGTARRSQQALFDYLAEVGIGLALGVLLEGSGMVDDEANGHAAAAAVSPEVSYFQRQELLHLQRRVKELLDQLNPQQRLVIRYHYLQEVPFDEIAALLGVTRSRVSQLHRQGLQSLRDHLGGRGRCDTLW